MDDVYRRDRRVLAAPKFQQAVAVLGLDPVLHEPGRHQQVNDTALESFESERLEPALKRGFPEFAPHTRPHPGPLRRQPLFHCSTQIHQHLNQPSVSIASTRNQHPTTVATAAADTYLRPSRSRPFNPPPLQSHHKVTGQSFPVGIRHSGLRFAAYANIQKFNLCKEAAERVYFKLLFFRHSCEPTRTVRCSNTLSGSSTTFGPWTSLPHEL